MTSLVEELEKVHKASKKHLERIFPDFIFPKEIELVKELNEVNKEEYERWLYKKKITDKLLGKHPVDYF